ncbi:MULTISPECIES: WD40 repeat domain-containing protein [unclassified Rhodococcus (in: high G+C Gram-positive bacteria)]|uniref:WD40 repeat domain-containing protein n=1 Tax=unclassified Rhodococcus (in: high G+C Gram-positive bacteria) TaxID=192944 RepID=UPI002953B91D|nr:WD40 repeat domain-containing protein [Rhodococcus sp. IEGM 1343]MDV8053788.1 WD40 repeat domain-containing protein [Rhodococcus sp. IEGM 1343]
MTIDRPDPSSITDRTEFAAALRAIRTEAGATVREIVERSGGLHGTIGGWFSGHHVPTKASAEMFAAVLIACGVADEDERALWWDAVSRVRSIPGRRTVDPVKGDPPYKGLEAFEPADAEWFFGRDDVIERLGTRVREALGSGGGIVFVVGASGSGKSSLLRAGLASRFPGSEVHSGVGDIRAFPERAESFAPGSVLVLDQAEELWTLATPLERENFLRAAAALPSAGSVLVVGLRADFYQNAVSEDALLAGLSDNPVVVGRLTESQLREVIVSPAAKAGVSVEAALVQVLVGELGPRGSQFAHDSGALPLLSHALLTTWQVSSGRTLTVSDYLATGGIGGAVGQSAEEVFSALTAEQQRETRRIFMRLVNLDDEVVTRRRVDRVELFNGDENEVAVTDVDIVVERFAARRLLTVGEETVQITHEALLTAWQRLREWLDDDRQWLVEHRRLTQAAELWENNDRDDGSLLPESRLALVQESLGPVRRRDLNSVERRYLDASANRIEQQNRSDRRRRRTLETLVTALALLTVLAVTLAVTAFVARSDANNRRVEAERAEAEAVSRQIAGVAEQLRTRDPGLAAYFALASYEVDRTTEARSSLLDSSAIHTPVRLLGVEGGAVTAVEPRGNIVATAGSDGHVRMWSLADGHAKLGEIVLRDARVLTFDPQGSVLAVGGSYGVELWDVANPSAPMLLSRIDATGVSSLSYSPDGRLLLVGTQDDTLPLLDVADPTAPRTIGEVSQPGSPTATEFSPDSRYLVTAGPGRAMRLWDATRLTASPAAPVVPLIDVPSDGSTYTALQLAFSPDGTTLIAGTTGREVLRWAVDGGRLTALPALTGFTSYVNDVAFSGDGVLIAAASSDNTTKVWDADSGTLQRTLPGPIEVTSLAFSPDRSSIVTASGDGITRIWPLPGPALVDAGDTIYQNPIGASDTRMLVGAGSRAPATIVWDVTDVENPVASAPLVIGDGAQQTGAVALTADGTRAAVGTTTGGFQLWDTTDLTDPVALGGIREATTSLTAGLVFDGTGSLLVVSGQNSNDVSLWSLADPTIPRALSTLEAGNYPAGMALSPDGSVLVIASVGGVVELWDISDPTDPRRRTTLGGFGSDVQAVAISPDGRTLAAGSADRSIRLWDMENPDNPQHLSRIVGPSSPIWSLSFDRSGTRLAAGEGGSTLWLWNVGDRYAPEEYAALTAYGQRVYTAVFGAGGQVLFGGGSARDLRMWQTEPDEVRSRLCESGGSVVTEAEWDRYLPGVPYRQLCET